MLLFVVGVDHIAHMQLSIVAQIETIATASSITSNIKLISIPSCHHHETMTVYQKQRQQQKKLPLLQEPLLSAGATKKYEEEALRTLTKRPRRIRVPARSIGGTVHRPSEASMDAFPAGAADKHDKEEPAWCSKCIVPGTAGSVAGSRFPI
jgi:hypothetical protein